MGAMEELLQLAEMGEPLWFSSIDGVNDLLNIEEYNRRFARGNESMPNGIKTAVSRETALVYMNHINLVEIFMNTVQSFYFYYSLHTLLWEFYWLYFYCCF